MLVVALSVYAECTRYQLLTWDDLDYVTDNPALRMPLGRFLAHVTTDFVPRAHGDFLPATLLTYWIEFQAVGLQPWLYHLDNAVFFAAACVALFYVLGRITGRPGLALLAALFFAAHPLNVEAVAWVSERKSVLSFLFCMLAFALALPPREAASRAKHAVRPRLIGSVLLYGLACLSKSAVVFFPILVWGCYWITARRSFGGASLRALPYVVPAGLTAWARIQGHAVSGQADFTPFDSLAAQVLTILSLLGKYLANMLLPLRLNHCYPLEVTESPADIFVWIGLGMLVLVLLGMVKLPRSLPVAAFGLLWFLAGWLPHMQLRPIPPALRADRYMFYALPGFILFLLALLDHFLAPEKRTYLRRWVAVLGGLLVVVSALAARQRQLVWENDTTLWEDGLAKTPDSVIANSHYGVILLEAGRFDQAERHFRRALAASGQDFMSLNGLAAVLSRRGEAEGRARAIELLNRALQVPNVPPEKRAQTYAALGGNHLARRDLAAALEAYARATELNPHLPDARGGYASALALSGKLDQALAHHRRAVELAPDDPTLLFNYSLALTSAGRTAEAQAALRRCLQLDPSYASAHAQLGVIQANLQNWPEAVGHFAEAARLDPNDRQIAEYLRRAKANLPQTPVP